MTMDKEQLAASVLCGLASSAYTTTTKPILTDVFNENSTTPKKLAHICTQTSASFKLIESSSSQNMQTQVNSRDFAGLRLPEKITTDTQTDSVKGMRMLDIQTQISLSCKDTENLARESLQIDRLPQRLSTDTQTQINANNFRGILKKLTMDTQTDLCSNSFTFPSESTDTDAQTDISWDDLNPTFFENSDSRSFNTATGRLSSQVNLPISSSDVGTMSTDLSNESGTQTEALMNELITMGTQTTFLEELVSCGVPMISTSNEYSCQGNTTCRDQSIRLENMLCQDECSSELVVMDSSNISTQTSTAYDSGLTAASSNISTQTTAEQDDWLTANLICESSSTQTDFFENLDFMDIDFQINNSEETGGGDADGGSGSKSNMETQTTIPLSSMLESPLDKSFYVQMVDKECFANSSTEMRPVVDSGTQIDW